MNYENDENVSRHYLHIKVMMKWQLPVIYLHFAARSSTILFMKCKVAVYNKPRVPAPGLLTPDPRCGSINECGDCPQSSCAQVPPRPRVLLLQITNVIICVGREMVWKDGDGEKLLVTRHSAQTSGHASLNMDNILPVIISTFYVHSGLHPYQRIIISSHLCMLYNVYILELL